MKKKIGVLIIIIIISALRLTAQVKDSIVVLPPVIITSPTVVSSQVDKAFKKAFPEAQKLKWYRMDKDFLARFIQKDMKHQALLSSKGSLRYDISYGEEKNLPASERAKVEDAYPDYKISSVYNVKQSGRNIWIVNLEGMKQYVVARIEGQDVEEVDKFNKAK